MADIKDLEIEISEDEEATEETLAELSDGKGDDDNE